MKFLTSAMGSKCHFLIPAFISILFSACIKNAPLNPEADIEAFEVDPEFVTSSTTIDQINNKIQLYLTSEAFGKGVAPQIRLSGGATVSPASGDSIHFQSGPVQYTVVSENGVNKKVYTVEVVNVGNWSFDFETWRQHDADKYEYPVEADGIEIWNSGNPGVSIAGVSKQPDAYPTRSTTEAFSGSKAAELVTIKGTVLSEFVGAYIFSGSIFLGIFDPSVALANPLKATQFGQPYVGLPQKFIGYYKYTPGASFQDEHKNIIAGKTDECAVYAVLFKGPDRLDATNVHTSDRVIANAVLPNGGAQPVFTRFEIPFVYKPGWDGNAQNLMLAIIASSSKEGDYYRGAIGSKLVLDSLAIMPQ